MVLCSMTKFWLGQIDEVIFYEIVLIMIKSVIKDLFYSNAVYWRFLLFCSLQLEIRGLRY